MLIRDMFEKQIDRDIKGVIKVGQDQESNITQELEEYVVTKELNRRFGNFFDAYEEGINRHTDKMGVWISGFFGSGKSHFLKILSYLLENKVVNGERSVHYFDGKITDQILLGKMQRAGDVSTDVILFNIDSKSDSDSKLSKEAIVKVFNRVFDDMLGYCGSIPWVADIERQMDADGTYDAFKNSFREIASKEWADAREDFYYEEDAIVEALAAVTKMSVESARNWFNNCEKNYTLSVEKFAKRVHDYIERKGKNHHVVFCVDEIGQYIGDNSGLMLNLQTVVEDLGTQCGGRAWVIVTSQQDIDSVTNVKGNDFSKIQGRFNTRLSLSSANVDEVIRKRILKKNPDGTDRLKLLYENKNAIINNLITFSADTSDKKKFANADDFAAVYPFLPYQFNLMQEVLTSVRIHGSSGKHLSEGERSMISAFQESAITFKDCEEGKLVPFSAFFDTIETFLDSNIRTVILWAMDNQNLNDFDVELLKILFMIKYIKELPRNIENLATLMVRDIDDDKLELKKKIEDSLKRLIKETLVEKNGEEYFFLTNEEQDIGKEIKNIQVDMSEVIGKISEIIFEDIYDNKRFKYSAQYNFSFNQIVDDKAFRGNQSNDIGIKVITPYYDMGSEMTQLTLKEMSQKENNLIVQLPPDASFLTEMEEVLKIQTYLMKKGGTTATQTIEDIKNQKSREVGIRKERVKALLIEAIRSADLYVNSQKLDVKGKDPADKINEGLHVLIDCIYTKLNYITKFISSPNEISSILYHNEIQLTIGDEPNKLAIDEISSFIERNTMRNVPVTMKTVLTTFQKAPFGWNEEDIEGIVALLFKRQEIKLQLNSEYLDIGNNDLVRYITKRDYVEKLLAEKRIRISIALINAAKEIIKETFNVTALPADEDGMMARVKKLCEDEIGLINMYLENYRYAPYPGEAVLKDGLSHFQKLLKIRDTREFFNELKDMKDDLLDYSDYAHDIKKFFEKDGMQKKYFDNALKMAGIYQKNKTYVLDPIAIDLYNQINRIVTSKEPYSEIFKLPDLIEQFTDKFGELLEQECAPVRTVIAADKQKVLDELDMTPFKAKFIDRFRSGYDDLLHRLDSANDFYEAIAMKEESDRLKLRYMGEMEREAALLAAKQAADNAKANSNGDNTPAPAQPPKQKKTVNISMANILHGTRSIESKNDIDTFLNELRAKLERELNEDTVIKIV